MLLWDVVYNIPKTVTAQTLVKLTIFLQLRLYKFLAAV